MALLRRDPSLSPEEFRLLRDAVGSRTGLSFSPDMRGSF